jgi:carbonic anhydrase
MEAIDELFANNRARAGADPPTGTGDPGAARPSKRIAVVTCMDARIDPAAVLGLEPGEAHVLRNAGAAVTDDVIRSLAISQRLLGTEEVMVIGHTLCGMKCLDEGKLTAELTAAAGGVAPTWAIESFADLDAGVRESVARVRNSPFLEYRDRVRGFVYEVESGRLREVSVCEVSV